MISGGDLSLKSITFWHALLIVSTVCLSDYCPIKQILYPLLSKELARNANLSGDHCLSLPDLETPGIIKIILSSLIAVISLESQSTFWLISFTPSNFSWLYKPCCGDSVPCGGITYWISQLERDPLTFTSEINFKNDQ